MSDKKFNLKNYKKINGDEHIDMRLEECRSEAPNVINEKQLEDYRSTESNVTIEKMLEKNRTGEETEITERRLDTHKAKFANKYRNEEAYTGNMNKVEEQRLQGDPSEKEKYEAASEAPKQFRWWEGVKSPDGLKVAQKKTEKIIVAKEENDEKYEEMTFDKPRFEQAEEEGESKDFTKPAPRVLEEMPQEEFNIDVVEPSPADYSQHFFISQEKFLPNKFEWLSGVYMVLEYDPADLPSTEYNIKQGALDKILSIHPELANVIDESDLHVKEEGGQGIVKLIAHGEEFAPIIEEISARKKGTIAEENITPEQTGNISLPIEELSYEEKDMAGTPMATGRIKINTPITDENRISIIGEVVEFVKKQHPGLQIEKDSLNLSNLSSGQVEYIVGIGKPEVTAGSDFDIIVESDISKKN